MGFVSTNLGQGMRGTVDYTNYDDMKYAIRKLDDSLFRNQFSLAYIRVEEYGSRCSYSRSLSRSPYSRSRSPSRSSGYRDMNRSVSPTGSYSRCASSRSHSQSVTSLSEAGSPPCSVPRHRSRSRTPASSPPQCRRVSASPGQSLSRSRSKSHSLFVRSD